MSIQYQKCSYPDCSKGVIPAQSNKLELCAKHYEMLQFFFWAIELVQETAKKQERPSGLIIPK